MVIRTSIFHFSETAHKLFFFFYNFISTKLYRSFSSIITFTFWNVESPRDDRLRWFLMAPCVQKEATEVPDRPQSFRSRLRAIEIIILYLNNVNNDHTKLYYRDGLWTFQILKAFKHLRFTSNFFLNKK